MDRPSGMKGAGAGRRGLRAQLGATVVSAAGPYGYTISLGGSVALAVAELGSAGLVEALLLMLGAVAAFVALEAIAHGTLEPQPAPMDRPPSIWGNAHVLSAGGALCAVSAAIHLWTGWWMWAVVGFLATSVYFVGTALQRIVVRKIWE